MDKLSKLGYLAGASRFRRISEKLYVDGDKIYKNAGIDFKASWFSVFYSLMVAYKPMTVNDLASEIGFTHITVKNILRELEDDGLVSIEENPNDKRSKHIELSKKGLKLVDKLIPVWGPFLSALKDILRAGHPDFLSIITRIENEIVRKPIYERVKENLEKDKLNIYDYAPQFKGHFYTLAGNWLLGILDGKLEKEDEFTLKNPDKAYLLNGGFVFYAEYNGKIIGCVALKRLTEKMYEFCKLFIDPEVRNLGVATKLIERCISRCYENNADILVLQTTNDLKNAHKLYYKMGFTDIKPPKGMGVLKRTQKIMGMKLS